MSPQPTIRDRLKDPALIAEMGRAMPGHCSPERMARIALTAISRVPKLAECDQASFFRCLMDLSQWGLEPDGRRAHLIPFENRKRKIVECQLILDYKGLVELAYRSGIVEAIHADVVRTGDLFRYSIGEVLEHVPHFLRTDDAKPDNAGEVLAVYCVVRIKGGCQKTEVLSVEEIEGIRRRSRAGNSGPWVSDWGEMAKKGLAVDTELPTPHGWKAIGDIVVGDTVFDMDGTPTTVVAVSERKLLDCFRIIFADGESITCDDEHRWVARIDGHGRPGWPVHTINELYAAKQAGLPVSLPVAGSLQLPDIDLPIDSWLLGYWLGNGSTGKASVTCHQSDVQHVVASIPSSFELGSVRNSTNSKAASIGIRRGFKAALRNSKILDSKRIPDEYLRSSHAQRLRLLQGLMDSDGHIERKRGKAIFEQTRKDLAVQVCELLASLGEKFVCNEYVRRGFGTSCNSYRIEWQPRHCPALMSRKAELFRPRSISPYRGVAAIVRTPTVPTVCIAVDSPTSTYLAGRTMVPTHNTTFRRVSKWLPLSAEIADAFERDDDVIESIAHKRPAVTSQPLSGLTELLSVPAIESDEATHGQHVEDESQDVLPEMPIEDWETSCTVRFAAARNLTDVADIASLLKSRAADEPQKQTVETLANATRERLRATKKQG